MKIEDMLRYVVGQFLGGLIVGSWIQPHASLTPAVFSGEFAIFSFGGLLAIEGVERAWNRRRRQAPR